jgi:hypothetical protein
LEATWLCGLEELEEPMLIIDIFGGITLLGDFMLVSIPSSWLVRSLTADCGELNSLEPDRLGSNDRTDFTRLPELTMLLLVEAEPIDEFS